jgi:beta-glucosidase
MPRRIALICALMAALAALLPAAATAAGRCGEHPWCDTSLDADRRAGLLLNALTRDERISLLAGDDLFGVAGQEDGHIGTLDGVERVGMPPVYFSDGPVGVRSGQATAFPASMAVAASFDREIARRHGAAIGDEAKKEGNDVVYAPAVNMMRTPLNGRTFEYFGEDPFLAARATVEWTKGLQAQGVIGNVKHYAVNNQEGPGTYVPGAPLGTATTNSRMTVDARLDERTLREIYLPQFEAAVKEANVGSVMCAYNRVNGTYACENEHLLNVVLKRDWGFKGFVLTDYGAAKNTVNSLNNGLDLDIWPGIAYRPENVRAALAASQVSEATVDEHVRRILRTLFAYGFFDREAYRDDASQVDVPGHHAESARLLEAGITLLRNDRNVLPLDAGRIGRLAVIGPEIEALRNGGGSSAIQPYQSVTPLQGLQERLGADKVVADDGGDAGRAAEVARGADAAVVVVGDRMTEGSDKPCMGLNCGQQDDVDRDALIDAVAAAQPNTAVVLQTGGPVTTPWRDRVPALVEAWYPGQNGGTAIARVLFGDVDPGGRLPATFPLRESDEPVAGDQEAYPGVAERVQYKEGVFIGYRWFDARNLGVAYPFGHGLSYTTFAYRNLRVDRDARVTAEVTNTGSRTGYAVPQLYVSMPVPRAGVEQPPRQLKGFEKVELRPGETRTVSFALDDRSFAYWDPDGDSWRVAPGCYGVHVGASSRDLPLEGVVARGGAACGAGAVAVAGSERSCLAASPLRGVRVQRRGRGLRVVVPRGRRIDVDVFRQSAGRRVLGERRVARFNRRTRTFTWRGRGRRVGDGYYSVRLRTAGTSLRHAFVRRRGRFAARPAFERREGCGLLTRFKLERPAFGGRSNRPLNLSYRLAEDARVTISILRGRRVLRRIGPRDRRTGITYRLRIRPERLARGDYRVRISARRGSARAVIATLTGRRL